MLSRAKTEISELELPQIINHHFYFGQFSMNLYQLLTILISAVVSKIVTFKIRG